jgi:hypothetical protein
MLSKAILIECEARVLNMSYKCVRGFRAAEAAAAILALTPGLMHAQQPSAEDAFLPSPVRVVSTVPANGDVNPYGAAFVPGNFDTSSGPLKHGDILISNFNNKSNLQGTGSTIVRVPASGSPSLFFQGGAGLGLSTALGTLAGRIRGSGQRSDQGWHLGDGERRFAARD